MTNVSFQTSTTDGRTLGLLGATSIGVGAIVGGGILALAGVAFATTGPSAILAFIFNGIIALLTALSFAELSAAYPRSGGTYAFAKRVLNVHTAFIVGWIVWFASIVAAVLYALGFAVYTVIVLERFWNIFLGTAPLWLTGGLLQRSLAILACLLYTLSLLRPQRGGGDAATYGKVIVFIILIVGGLWVLGRTPMAEATAGLTPFAPSGVLGIFQAMGFTFIALQGFDLITAVAGEVKDPVRTIPRSMVFSLAIALFIYIPLLFIVTTVGLAEGQSIVALSQAQPEAVIANAAQQYLGATGYWLVMVAALLAMLSALQANLFAASRIAQTMALDRTLPRRLGRLNGRGTPAAALWLSLATLILLLLLIPDVASAGAAASLIFLISFALVHLISVLARQRAGAAALPFRLPVFPLIPALGGLACVVLAVFQGIVVPSAGVITLVWVGVGLGIYTRFFAGRAQVADATAEALDPSLIQLRGRSPLVLLPIANPDNVVALVGVANALTPPKVGRVLLLSIIRQKENEFNVQHAIQQSQHVLARALEKAYSLNLFPEALTTASYDPWEEIARVAKTHHCEGLLLGMQQLSDDMAEGHLKRLLNQVGCDVSLLRAPSGWTLMDAKRILVPVAGGAQHDALRARLLTSLVRTAERQISFLRVLSPDVTPSSERRAELALKQFASEEVWGEVSANTVKRESAIEEILEQSKDHNLIILGSERSGRSRTGIGTFAKQIVQEADCAVLVISRRV